MKAYPFIFLILILFPFSAASQPSRVLHFTKTSGFDHLTRTASYAMFQQMGNQFGFIVDDDSTGQSFNSTINLQLYDAIIFSNTSGDQILDSVQKINIESFLSSGKAFIGIHSASDTYRHSTANGNNTGSWDWYAEMLGASVQENPNHVAGIPVYRIDAIASHVLLNGIPNPWNKAEEYYYWENGYFDSTNLVLQKVEQTIGPNMLVNSYDSARAVTWCRTLLNNGKMFYTSLGHDVSNFTSDTIFYRLLSNALSWALDTTTNMEEIDLKNQISIYPNPVRNVLIVSQNGEIKNLEIKLFDELGREVLTRISNDVETSLRLDAFSAGVYYLHVKSANATTKFKVIRK